LTTIEASREKVRGPKGLEPKHGGAEVTLATEPMALCETFGVRDPDVAARLLGQLLGVMHPDTSGPVDGAVVNLALALIKDIGPTDATEAMTATLMAAAHLAAQDCGRRAMHPGQTPGGRATYLGLALKAMRTFSQLKQALDFGRGKSTTQRVIVERLTVQPGAQAVIAVDARTGGGG
jgi:hypothetical protein